MPEPSFSPAKLLITGGENKSPGKNKAASLFLLGMLLIPGSGSLLFLLKKDSLTTVFTHFESFPQKAAQHAAYQKASITDSGYETECFLI